MMTVEISNMLSPDTVFEAKVKVQYDASSNVKYGEYLRRRQNLFKELAAEIGEDSFRRLGHWTFFKHSEDALAFYMKLV